jgi:hypothetical protein
MKCRLGRVIGILFEFWRYGLIYCAMNVNDYDRLIAESNTVPFLAVSSIIASCLYKKVSALNPVDMLDHKIRVGADELLGAVDDFVKTHS